MSEDVTYNDLIQFKISPGTVKWRKRTGKETILLNLGDIIDHRYLEKFDKSGSQLKIEWKINKDLVYEGIGILKKLKNCTFDKEAEVVRKEFVEFLRIPFWEGEESGNLIDLAMIGEGTFNQFSTDQVKIMSEIHLDLYKRLSLMSALNAIMSFISGYMKFSFLKEVYYLSFCFDIFCKSSPIPGHYLDIFDESRYLPKEAFNKFDLSDQENIQSFFKKEGYKDYIKDIYSFSIPGVARIIERSRERIKSGGFPKNLNENELSDLEKIIILNQEALPYNSFSFQDGDGRGYIKKLLSSQLDSDDAVDVNPRIKNLISSKFEEEAA